MIGSLFDMFTAAMLIFLCKSLYMQTQNNILSPLTDWPTWINILWKWASMLTELNGDDESRLAWICAITNFLANEIYLFSRVLTKRLSLNLGSLLHIINSSFSYFYLFKNAMSKIGFCNFKLFATFFRIQFSLVVTFFAVVYFLCLS